MKKNDGGPAFPATVDRGKQRGIYLERLPGMPLRDWFAGMALIGHCVVSQGEEIVCEDMAAAFCYRMADAMLAKHEEKVMAAIEKETAAIAVKDLETAIDEIENEGAQLPTAVAVLYTIRNWLAALLEEA